jgi:uncharacterized repeat protein (TIGR01451 family)
MNERTTKGPLIGVSLVMGVGLVVLLLWMARADVTGDPVPIARAADPAKLTLGASDVYCVALEGGGPYSGCDQVFTGVQSAVDAASGGEIIKIAAGVYTGVQSRPAPPGYLFPPPSGLIAQVAYVDKAVAMQGGYTITNGFADPPDATANPTTLDAQGQGRAIFIAGDVRLTVEGLRITGGDADGLGGYMLGDAGGGVYVLSTTATISNNRMFGNSAGNGGGLFLYHSDATVVSNTVTYNTASSRGGGLGLLGSDATIDGNMITDNIAASGGGLGLHWSDATVVGNTVTSNTAQYLGGGLSLERSDATLSGNTIVANTSQRDGGGLTLSSCSAMLTGNTIASNVAFEACGGLCVDGGDATLSGNTISNNTAGTSGGGLRLRFGDATLTGNTIASNTAQCGGGLFLEEVDEVTFSGNMVVSNTAAASSGGGLFVDDGRKITSNGDTFTANTAHWSGGGLYMGNDTRATFTKITVISNTAAASGGGLVLGEDTYVTLRQSTVASNTAAASGGGLLVVDNYDATLIDNIIIGNQADTAGGGLYACFWSIVTLDGNVVLSNTARYGGGLYLQESQATLTNNIVADNQAGVAGSGLYVDDSSLELLHTTIARNGGGDGSALLVTDTGWPDSTVAMTNTILVGHTVGVTVTAGNTVTLQATLWGTGTWANTVDWGGAGAVLTGTPAYNYWEAPAFADPDAGDYHIRSGSAAIDAGVDAGIYDDMDGQGRPHYGGCDLGADEWWSLVVTKAATPTVAEPGDVVAYTLTLTNTTDAAIVVRLTDTLPAQVSYLGPLTYSNGSGGHSSGVVTWTGTVLTGTPTSLAWTAQIAFDTPYSTTISNTATVSDTYGLFQTDPTLILVPPRRFYFPLMLRDFYPDESLSLRRARREEGRCVPTPRVERLLTRRGNGQGVVSPPLAHWPHPGQRSLISCPLSGHRNIIQGGTTSET